MRQAAAAKKMTFKKRVPGLERALELSANYISFGHTLFYWRFPFAAERGREDLVSPSSGNVIDDSKFDLA
jgi:hypothetical protein